MYRLTVKSETLANDKTLIKDLIDELFNVFDLSSNNENVVVVINEIDTKTMCGTATFTITINIPVTKDQEVALLHLLDDKYECQWMREGKGFAIVSGFSEGY